MNDRLMMDLAKRSWLQRLTLDQLIEAWWDAQWLRAEAQERLAARTADPQDLCGKPVGYVRPEIVSEFNVSS